MLRKPFYGDTHVHTALSLDAYVNDTRLSPSEAYRFAQGDEVDLPPYDEEGRALRNAQLERPLDFAIVTDHAEFLGEMYICSNPEEPGYESRSCQIYRSSKQAAAALFLPALSLPEAIAARLPFCGPDGSLCSDATRTPWSEIRDAAEAAYDRTSACRFTSFVGYEWTGAPLGNNLHRNVIFRDKNVPAQPFSYFDGPFVEDLWDHLTAACIEADPNCDVLTIPHNSNLSGGRMFETVDRQSRPYTAEVASRRASFEPLVEVVQHKGASECLDQEAVDDPLCNFEIPPWGKVILTGEPDPRSYVRNALREGLSLQRTLGANPFKYGMIGSTDTHFGTPGLTDEQGHPGHGGVGFASTQEGLSEVPEYGPGGLAVVWAEENSRSALFAAMERKEVYATSGPRITTRFFGGANLDPFLCESPTMIADADEQGVPMGGDLPGSSVNPRFLAAAAKDLGTALHPGGDLQRIQIIKGWIDEAGTPQERVLDVAGDADRGSVDLSTCERLGTGFSQLCAVWEDTEFDASEHAFYYARVLETPSCRWHTYACNDARVDCSDPEAVAPGFEACCDEDLPKSIQERAWTSPIWFTPAP